MNYIEVQLESRCVDEIEATRREIHKRVPDSVIGKIKSNCVLEMSPQF